MTAPVIRQHSGAYWLRMAGIAATTGVVLALLFAMFGGDGPSFPTRLWRSLVHSCVMASLCASILPRLVPRVVGLPMAARVVIMIGVLISLPAAGSMISCGIIAYVLGHHTFWPCLTLSFPVNALIASTLGMGVTLYETQRAQLSDLTL